MLRASVDTICLEDGVPPTSPLLFQESLLRKSWLRLKSRSQTQRASLEDLGVLEGGFLGSGREQPIACSSRESQLAQACPGQCPVSQGGGQGT